MRDLSNDDSDCELAMSKWSIEIRRKQQTQRPEFYERNKQPSELLHINNFVLQNMFLFSF